MLLYVYGIACSLLLSESDKLAWEPLRLSINRICIVCHRSVRRHTYFVHTCLQVKLRHQALESSSWQGPYDIIQVAHCIRLVVGDWSTTYTLPRLAS